MSLCLLVDLVSDFQTHRANSSSRKNQKMQVGNHQYVIISQFSDFHVVKIHLHVYGHRRAVEFHHYLAIHDSHWPSPASWLCCKT